MNINLEAQYKITATFNQLSPNVVSQIYMFRIWSEVYFRLLYGVLLENKGNDYPTYGEYITDLWSKVEPCFATNRKKKALEEKMLELLHALIHKYKLPEYELLCVLDENRLKTHFTKIQGKGIADGTPKEKTNAEVWQLFDNLKHIHTGNADPVRWFSLVENPSSRATFATWIKGEFGDRAVVEKSPEKQVVNTIIRVAPRKYSDEHFEKVDDYIITLGLKKKAACEKVTQEYNIPNLSSFIRRYYVYLNRLKKKK